MMARWYYEGLRRRTLRDPAALRGYFARTLLTTYAKGGRS